MPPFHPGVPITTFLHWGGGGGGVTLNGQQEQNFIHFLKPLVKHI